MSDGPPPGWELAKLEDVSTLHQGCGFPKDLQGRSSGDLAFFKVSDISRAIAAGSDTLDIAAHYISDEEAERLRARPLPEGSVVFARIGEAIRLNRRALLARPSLIDNNVIGVKACSGVEDRYLLHFLQTVRLGDLSQATTVPAVRSSDIAEIEIPLAPTKAQQRIVSKIDELFSRIDEGERWLTRVATLVERYRQSVLKAAVTGELTRDWREKNQHPLESGEALLARILKARREAWEKAELDKMKAKSITPANDKWKQKYEEPAPPDTSGLPELPAGWAWLSLDAVAEIVGGITVDQKRDGHDLELVPYLRVANVQRGYLDLSEIKSIRAPRDRIEALSLRSGDILFNEGGDLDKLGRGWIWESQVPLCIHQNHVFRARLYIEGGHNKIISWYCNVLGRTLFMSMGKQTTNLASLSLSKLKSLPVPVMSRVEATEIVSMAEDVLSVVDKQREELERQSKGSSALRQSVLRSAFSGLLVSQEEADEPASVLLDRIASARINAPASAKRGRKPKTSKPA